jgi:hypothetical protein
VSSVVVVDDERTFDAEVDLYARTATEAIGCLGRIWTRQQVAYLPALDELWLDHDLGADDTGMQVAEFLTCLAAAGASLGVGIIYVHSMNPFPANAMVALLKPFYSVRRVPLPALRA